MGDSKFWCSLKMRNQIKCTRYVWWNHHTCEFNVYFHRSKILCEFKRFAWIFYESIRPWLIWNLEFCHFTITVIWIERIWNIPRIFKWQKTAFANVFPVVQLKLKWPHIAKAWSVTDYNQTSQSESNVWRIFKLSSEWMPQNDQNIVYIYDKSIYISYKTFGFPPFSQPASHLFIQSSRHFDFGPQTYLWL